MAKAEPSEDFPLLPSTSFSPTGSHRPYAHGRTAQEKQALARLHITRDRELAEYDDEEEDEILFADRKKRGISLISLDAVLMILHTLQMFALLQSLSLRWPWPLNWIKYTNFIFVFNVDVWEFMKVATNGTYYNVHAHYTPSATVPVSYWYILLAWAIFIFLLLLSFIISYFVIIRKKHPYMFVQIAQLQRVYIVIFQIIAIPIGIVIARLFHCTDLNLLDVNNELKCYKNTHWAYIGPSIAFAILFYIVYPTWLIIRTNAETLNMTPDRHEGYLQLKETEYVHGLDVLWLVGGFHVFSSFKKIGAHFRASLHILLAAVLIVYAILCQHLFYQAVIINSILGCMMLAFVIIRPFRVAAFNLMLFVCYLCLTMDCLMGSLLALFDSASNFSVWLTPYYVTIVLCLINCFWVICTIAFVIYLIARHTKFCRKCCPNPLWPSLDSHGLSKLNPKTRRYIRAVLRSRVLIEKSLLVHPIFSPAHELSRYIHIVNAFCREAEYLRDPIQDALWDILDELIEAHSQIAPKSLFAESVKNSIRLTAGDFMKLMPMFVRRLAQREYDFILMTPRKRRMLLKMYCLGVFLNGRREKIERERLTMPAIQRVWHTKKQTRFDETEDDGYYEDMYPEVEEGPSFRPLTAITIDVRMVNEAEIDDEVAIQEAEEWAEAHPLSRMGQSNLGFADDDVSAILRDDVSMDLSQMLMDVPSAPGIDQQSRPGSALLSPEPGPLLSSSSVSPSGAPGSRPHSAASNGHRQSGDDEERNATSVPGQDAEGESQA